MVKATFVFDEETFNVLRRTAERLAAPQSKVVRDAIRTYSDRMAKLSEEDRNYKLKIMDEILARSKTRSKAEVEEELREIRHARRRYGRKHNPG